MSTARQKLERARLAPINLMPLQESFTEAFEAIEQLDSRHSDARGTSYAGIRTAETRDVARRMTQDAR